MRAPDLALHQLQRSRAHMGRLAHRRKDPTTLMLRVLGQVLPLSKPQFATL